MSRTQPCRWATGELDVTPLEWTGQPHILVYRRCCQAQEGDPRPCVFCMENWTRADHTAMDVISGNPIFCHGPYRGVKVTLNRITPEPKIS